MPSLEKKGLTDWWKVRLSDLLIEYWIAQASVGKLSK